MKQAKIAIIVVCLALAGFLIWKSLSGGGSQLPGSKRLVNILTGEVSSMDTENLSVIPYPDADGRRVLYPATRDEAGNWIVPEQFRVRIAEQLDKNVFSESELAIDLNTFAIQK